MAGKGGGAWKVAYADFVTAMMAFFMVMWLLSQNDEVKEAVALHFRNPYGQFAVGDSLMPPRETQYFKERVRVRKGQNPPAPDQTGPPARKPYTLTLHRGERTIVGTVVTFAPEETQLNDQGREQLNGFVPRVHGKPQKIEIRGHALRRSSTVEATQQQQDPWLLSYTRCLSAMNYLIEQGIPAERIRLSQAGPFEPYTLGNVPDDVANNSRIEVYLLNEVAEDALGKAEERDQRYVTHGDHGNEHTPVAHETTHGDTKSTNEQAPTGHSSAGSVKSYHSTSEHSKANHSAGRHAASEKKAASQTSSSHSNSGHAKPAHSSGHSSSSKKTSSSKSKSSDKKSGHKKAKPASGHGH